MAQTSGFFNALQTGGVYDRTYNAEDYTNNLAVIISDGVLRSTDDDLKPTANGMSVNIGIGRAWIRGRWYKNDAVYNLTVPTAPTTYPRKDRVMLRLDSSTATRGISMVYVAGTPAAVPVAPTPTDNTYVKDLVLADVDVAVNATTCTVTDKRGDSTVCGWVYSVTGDGSFFASLDGEFGDWFEDKKDELASVTLFKQYVWRGNTTTDGQTVVLFDIPQYDPTGVDIINVYFNGRLLLDGTDYTVSGNNTITFSVAKMAGQEVVVICYKSIDGAGLGSVADRVTALENTVAALDDYTNYNYICTGTDDNIALSTIAQNFLDGGDDGKQMTVHVYGTIGVTTPNAGSGTSASQYQWFSFGKATSTSRKIVFDFGSCSKITITATQNTENFIFYGNDVNVCNANVEASQPNTSTSGSMIACSSISGRTHIENCRIVIDGIISCSIGWNGVYRNCFFSVKTTLGNSFCFYGRADSFTVIDACELYAYTTTGNQAWCSLTPATSSTAVVKMQNTSCPTVSKTGLIQMNAVSDFNPNGFSSYIGTITTLPILATAQTVSGTAAISKPSRR